MARKYKSNAGRIVYADFCCQTKPESMLHEIEMRDLELQARAKLCDKDAER